MNMIRQISRQQPYPQILDKLHPQIALCYQRGLLSHLQASTLAEFQSHIAQLRILSCLDRHIFDDEILKEIKTGVTVLDLPDGEILFLPSRAAILDSEIPTAANSPIAA